MLEITRHGQVHEIRLARPPANALDPGLITALRRAVQEAPTAGARALVLSGAPGMFSGGLDVPHLVTLDRPAIRAAWHELFLLMGALATSPLPLVAAITGHAPAGGCVLALFCDLRVMAAGNYRIGLNEVAIGIPLPPSIYAAMVHAVGSRRAERLCVAGELILADRALEIGLVDELVALDAVVARAVELADGMSRLPGEALRKTRALARAPLVAAIREQTPEALDALVDDWYSSETQDALRALVEKLASRKR
jgi:enoyl-CoA hydratase/carnithine racemase